MDFGSGVTHLAFADEAYRDTGRFRSVACISLPVSNYEFINSAILDSSDSDSELKWSKVKNEDKARGVLSVYRRVALLALQRKLRADVLIWDTYDSRHRNVKGRDDIQNQQNMFRMLFRNVFENRWVGSNNCWDLAVDKQGLKSPERLSRDLDIFNEISAFVREANSREVPLIQVADIFAGIGAYSRLNSYEFNSWNKQRQGQQSLSGFGQLVSYGTNTKVEKVRFQLLSEVENLLKAHELPVIVDPARGLWTKNPNEENCNINFWPYTPQGAYDKAPVKDR